MVRAYLTKSSPRFARKFPSAPNGSPVAWVVRCGNGKLAVEVRGTWLSQSEKTTINSAVKNLSLDVAGTDGGAVPGAKIGVGLGAVRRPAPGAVAGGVILPMSRPAQRTEVLPAHVRDIDLDQHWFKGAPCGKVNSHPKG